MCVYTYTLFYQIAKLEEQNNIAVNVIGYAGAEEGFFPKRVSSSVATEIINLLLVADEPRQLQHYILVTNLSGLLGYNTAH